MCLSGPSYQPVTVFTWQESEGKPAGKLSVYLCYYFPVARRITRGETTARATLGDSSRAFSGAVVNHQVQHVIYLFFLRFYE